MEQGITGHHPDIGVLDDPISEEKLKESGVWLSAVNQSIAALRPAFRADSFFLLVGTRYRDNDPFGVYLSREGIRALHGMQLPDKRLEVKTTGEWDVYFLQAKDSTGSSILQEVHPTDELNKY